MKNKKGSFVPNYNMPGVKSKDYGKGYSHIVELFRDGKVDGIGEAAGDVKSIEQKDLDVYHLAHDYSFVRQAFQKRAGKYDHIDFKPPKGVADEAAKGLEYRKKADGEGGTDVGVQRAVNLKNRDEISPSVVRRMKAFFDRHKKNKKIEDGKQPWEDKGWVAWLLWGGDPGYSWAKKIVRQMEAADKKAKKSSLYAKRNGLPLVLAEDEWEGDFFEDPPNEPIKDVLMSLADKMGNIGLHIDDAHDNLLYFLVDNFEKLPDDHRKIIEAIKSQIEKMMREAHELDGFFHAALNHLTKVASLKTYANSESYSDFFKKELNKYEESKGKPLDEMDPKEKKHFFEKIIDDKWKSKDEQGAIDKKIPMEGLLPNSDKYIPHAEFLHGGEGDSSRPADFDIEQLEKGIEVELEHTDNPMVAREIAMDHLMEDPKYYDYLEEMEAQFDQNAHDKESDYMSLANISQIEEQVDSLLDHLEKADEDGERLEDWVEDKVSTISDDVEELYNYFEHRKQASKKDDDWEPTDKDKWKKALDWARRNYKVYPSAYANLGASRKYKELGGKWKKKKKSSISSKGNLREWLDEEWVDISRKNKDGSHPPCGRDDSDKGAYPKCRPKSEADKMSASEKESAVRQKREEDNPKSGKGNKPKRDSHKKKD